MNQLEEKEFKESNHPPDRRRGKKEKKSEKKTGKKSSKKSITPKAVTCPNYDSRHARSNTVAARSVELEEENTNASSVSTNLNKSMSGGWSWGAAFAAASRVQPTDLGEQFNATTTTTTLDSADEEGEAHHGIAHVSHLAHEYTSAREKVCPIAMERKPKRIFSEVINNGSDDDDDNKVAFFTRDPLAEESPEYSLKEQGSTKKSGPDFPYPTNPDDHCETPRQSYLDILPILNKLSTSFGGEKYSMRIYDPYYCDGSVVQHLSSLGFTEVYNKKEDCYEVWENSNSPPQYDVLITNPPYSEDHIEKLMNYVTSPAFGNRPWLLLMPQWVHKKEYYLNAISRRRACGGTTTNPFYIVPRKRYIYLPPANFREKKDSDVHRKSSPFVSMWFCWGGDMNKNEELMNEFRNNSACVDCDLARSKNALRDLRRSTSGDKNSKKFKKSGK